MVSGLPYMTPIFSRSWLMKMAMVLDLASVAGELAQSLAHEAGLEAHVGVAHLAFDLGRGVSAATESTTTTSRAPERISMSVISSACSPVSGWETSSSSTFTPMARA